MAGLLECKIRQRTYIAAPPEKVYDTITSAQKWDGFFTTGMELDPQPGGVCSFSWKDWGPDNYTLKVSGRVIEAKRPSLFTFQWGQEGNETTIRIQLDARDNGTIVTLTEDGYQDTPEGRAMILECAAGWGEAMTLLKFYLEHGILYNSAGLTAKL
jgi:uncharacterized protein YndB with AHSA1/START domain